MFDIYFDPTTERVNDSFNIPLERSNELSKMLVDAAHRIVPEDHAEGERCDCTQKLLGATMDIIRDKALDLQELAFLIYTATAAISKGNPHHPKRGAHVLPVTVIDLTRGTEGLSAILSDIFKGQ